MPDHSSHIRVSFHTKVLLVLLYIFPTLLDLIDQGNRYFHDILWFLYLIPTLILTFRSGAKYGTPAAGFGTIVFLLIEALQPDGIDRHELITMIELFIVNSLIVITVGILVNRNNERRNRLIESEERYRTLVEMSSDIISVHSNENLLYMNKTGFDLLQVSGDLKDIHLRSFLTKDLAYFKNKTTFNPNQTEVQIRSNDETVYDMEYAARPIHFNGEKATLVMAHNITKRKQLEQDLKESEGKYKSLVENSRVGVYLIQNYELVYVNQWFPRMLGISENELLGTHFINYIQKKDKRRLLNNFKKILEGEMPLIIEEIQVRNQAGTVIYLELQASLTAINGLPAIIGIALDVTDKKKANEEVEYLAFHDSPTGLLNMNYLNQYVTKEFEELKSKGIPICMMFFNLDRFKLINDAYGHFAGDQVLKMVSARLSQLLQHTGTVIRAGGDEFILYLPHMDSTAAEKLAQQLLGEFSESFYLDGREIRLAVSIGITCVRKDDSIEDAIQKASSALHFAKANGRNQYQLFSADFGETENRRFQIEQGLRKALEQSALEVYYQPKLDLFTNQISGMEALLRWNDPVLGHVSPDEFIPIAEETGMIVPIGKWVLETACRQNKAWNQIGLPPIHVCVNISARQFLQDDFVWMVQQTLDETSLPPELLNLEVTERIALYNINDAILKLEKLKQLGVSISLDDFGTGYSSLSYVKLLPIDFLKIDRSFITGILKNQQDLAIIDTIISLAHSLGYKVVAEGVEVQQQLQHLRERGCDEIQGYYLANPMAPFEFEEFLNKFMAKN